MQELATRIAHRNTGKLLDDPVGYELMARVAADENFHHLFYRDLTSAAIELDPSATMIAIDHEVRSFAMPGTGIPNFDVHAQRIARAGIYDLNVHHEQILVPIVMRQWKVAELTGLSAEAEKARDRLLRYLERAAGVGSRRGSDESESARFSCQARLPARLPASTGRGGGAGGVRSQCCRRDGGRLRAVGPGVVGCHQAGPADRDPRAPRTRSTRPLRPQSPSRGCRPCALPSGRDDASRCCAPSLREGGFPARARTPTPGTRSAPGCRRRCSLG